MVSEKFHDVYSLCFLQMLQVSKSFRTFSFDFHLQSSLFVSKLDCMHPITLHVCTVFVLGRGEG